MAIDKALLDELRAAQKAKEKTAYWFAFVSGGKNALLVSRGRVEKNAITVAKTKCGGSNVIEGRCYGGDGVIVFEPLSRADNSLGKKIKETAKTATGQNFEISLGAPGKAAAAPVGDRLAALLPVYQQIVKVFPERKG